MVDLSRPGNYISVDLVIFDTPYYNNFYKAIELAIDLHVGVHDHS
jgi:hypothetical protein